MIEIEMRKLLFICIFSVACAGCGAPQQTPLQIEIQSAQQKAAQAKASCEAQFKKAEQKTAIARQRCMNEAGIILRPYVKDPYLVDWARAEALVIAEKRQKGQISEIEAEAQFAAVKAKLASADAQRANADRSIAAQEQAADAARDAANAANKSRYTSCTQYSNGASCYTY